MTALFQRRLRQQHCCSCNDEGNGHHPFGEMAVRTIISPNGYLRSTTTFRPKLWSRARTSIKSISKIVSPRCNNDVATSNLYNVDPSITNAAQNRYNCAECEGCSTIVSALAVLLLSQTISHRPREFRARHAHRQIVDSAERVERDYTSGCACSAGGAFSIVRTIPDHLRYRDGSLHEGYAIWEETKPHCPQSCVRKNLCLWAN